MPSQLQPDGPPVANPPPNDAEPMQQDTQDAAVPNGDTPTQQHPAADDDAADDDAAPPASPPLPTRHTPVAPGPRAERLQELYAQRLQRTLRKLAWQNFAGCYPTVARKAEGVLRQVQSQMVDKLGEKCEKEFENILVARQVVPKLNDLESLIADAASRRAELSQSDESTQPTPPHLLPPDAILSAHLHPALTAHQSQLNARLQTTQSQNALLHDQVRQQREEIAALLDRLDAVVADVRGANDALRPVVDDLAAETRESLAAVEAVGT
ncbi:Nnf1-domain-containing protein [Thelonectria olida]|uniref:Nnf1-domain-containing protein n=1 Tax=Thelonectria olida TaxID=1576542 RepID=A0A9P8WEX9_9HYPO|nr:Nnf1-domain-containing protein [Thelonectria olida]